MERGGFVTYYRLYVFGVTDFCVRPGSRKDGGWYCIVNHNFTIRDRYLGQVKATLEMLLECYYAFLAAQEYWNKVLANPLRSRQRNGDRLGYAYNDYREIEKELDDILGEELVQEINQSHGKNRSFLDGPFQTESRIQEKFKTIFGE